ncbi:MAG: EamA family transporter, partial [Solirubrobacterales bacterium]|nr:EamA family transporter [Solirubrobacterales bacterium]
LIVLALTSQVLGWLLITTSLPRLPAAITSLLLTIQPVCAVILAAVILSESPSGLQLVGVAVVLGAVIMATRPGATSQRLSEQVLRLRPDQSRRSRSVLRGDVSPRTADHD